MNFIFKNFEEILSGLFLSITVIVVIANVILRYVFNTGLVWVGEVATGCFVWSVFVGSAAAYKHKMHIGIDVIVRAFPPKIQKFIFLCTSFLMILISGYITYLSTIFIEASHTKQTPVLGISSAYISASIFVGFALIFLYSIKYFIEQLRESP